MTRSRWRPWAWRSELRRLGILGMNRRNASYVLPCNPRQHYPRVDDKVLTKRICERRGIPVPETYAVIERQGDVRGALPPRPHSGGMGHRQAGHAGGTAIDDGSARPMRAALEPRDAVDRSGTSRVRTDADAGRFPRPLRGNRR